MRVHTLESLDLAAPRGKRLVVIGDPVAHSLSPSMHNAALSRMAVSAKGLSDWRYEAVQVPERDLSRALEILATAGVVGINLTLPHKVNVLDLVRDVDPEALTMGAVNTLKHTGSGYQGYNTDGYGIRKAVEEAFGRGFRNADVWLFGAGGAARGIAVACLQAGCCRLTILNRTETRLRELEEQLSRSGLESFSKARFATLDAAPEDPEAESLVINATSLGLKAGDPNPVDYRFLKPGAAVYDTTYGVRNRLALDCARIGLPYADGLSMLVWQGARSLEIWTGMKVPVDVMREAARSTLEKRLGNE